MNVVASMVCGLIFGAGLLISGMTQPAKVLGFLDVFGRWDPTLAFVMVAALVVSSAGFALARRSGVSLFAGTQQWPVRAAIDRPLVVGSVLFGTGWGLVGLCPGPAIENLATFSPRVLVFVLAMAAGVAGQHWWRSRGVTPGAAGDDALARADG